MQMTCKPSSVHLAHFLSTIPGTATVSNPQLQKLRPPRVKYYRQIDWVWADEKTATQEAERNGSEFYHLCTVALFL